MSGTRDHGGRLDAAIATHGGMRSDWLDLSTGINPAPYPVAKITDQAWQTLPDQAAFNRLYKAAQTFWNVPDQAAIIGASGTSAIIAALPHVLPRGSVMIPGPTYNEHEAAFRAANWDLDQGPGHALVAVHPNNPDGRMWRISELDAPFVIIDESFCDIYPDQSHVALASRPGTIILKSFGKFWGLAGLRLGFAIGHPDLITRLRDLLGPWQVSGPALQIGAAALSDASWAEQTRQRLTKDATRLDDLLTTAGAEIVGGTALFRTYQSPNAAKLHAHLASQSILTRTFSYAPEWIRLGLPAPDRWGQLEQAL